MNDSQTMTPMIDVVFLLLVFFICAAAGQVAEHSLSTELNAGSIEAGTVEASPAWTTEIRVKVTAAENGTSALVEMNGRRFQDYEQFRETLLALADVSRDSPVILDVADGVPMRDMIKIYDACRGAEFDSVNFAMKRSELKPRPL